MRSGLSQMLERGQTIQAGSSGLNYKVEELLGAGGQGEVYRATSGSQFVAVKWYFPTSATPEQRASLEALVKKGPPADQFLWPLTVCSAPSLPGFGYIMPL